MKAFAIALILVSAPALAMDIPAVVDHEQALKRTDVVKICRIRVEIDEKPCVVIDMHDKTCFAFMDFAGNPSTVHCFPISSERSL